MCFEESNRQLASIGLVMASHWTGHKPLPESMLTQFPDAYMRHYEEMR